MTTRLSPSGDEIRVESGPSGAGDPAIAGLAGGGFVVVWNASYLKVPTIRLQRFDDQGHKIGPDVGLSSSDNGSAWRPDVAALAGGGYVAVWLMSHPDDENEWYVHVRVFNALGVPISSNEFSAGQGQASASSAALPSGGFIVVWNDVTIGQIFARVYSSSGQPQNVEVSIEEAGWPVAVAGLTSGGFVLAYLRSDFGVANIRNCFQAYNSAGHKIGPEVTLSTDQVASPTIAALDNGNFVVCWSDFDSNQAGVKAQLFSSTGGAISGPFVVNSTIQGSQGAPTVAALDGGAFVVSWVDRSGQGRDSSGSAIKAQVFDAEGTRTGGEFLVNQVTVGNQSAPVVGRLSNGGAAVAWMDQSADIHVKARVLGSFLSATFESSLVEGSANTLTIQAAAPTSDEYQIYVSLIPGSASAQEISGLPSVVTMLSGETIARVPFSIRQNPYASVTPETFSIRLSSSQGDASIDGSIREFITQPFYFLKLNDQFAFDATADQMKADGTLLVGRAANRDKPLVRIENASAAYDDARFFLGSGTVYAEVGGTEAPLFLGSFQLPYSGNLTSTLTDEGDFAGDFELAGLDLTFRQLNLQPGALRAHVSFDIPFTVGTLRIDTELLTQTLGFSFGLLFDDSGTHLEFGPVVRIPGSADYDFAGLFHGTISDVVLAWNPATDLLKLQAKFVVDRIMKLSVTSVTVDFSGANFLEIQDGKIDFAGTLVIDGIGSHNDEQKKGFGVNALELGVNTKTKALSGGVEFSLPFGGRAPKAKVSIEGSWVDGPVVQKVSVAFDDLQIAVPQAPGVFWQSASIAVSGMFEDTVPTTFSGGLGFSFGPRIGSQAIGQLRLDGSASNRQLEGTSDLQIIPVSLIQSFAGSVFDGLPGVFPVLQETGTIKITFNSDPAGFESFAFSGSTRVLGGFITTEQSFQANGNLDFSLIGKAAVDFGPLFGRNTSLALRAGVDFMVSYSNDGSLSNDFAQVWAAIEIGHGGLSVTVNVSAKVSFDGTPPSLSFGKSPPATSEVNALFASAGAETSPVIGTPDVLLLTATWQNAASSSVSLKVTRPDGETLSENEFLANNIVIVPELTTAHTTTVAVFNPGSTADWSLDVTNADGLGAVAYTAAIPMVGPTIGAFELLNSNPDGTAHAQFVVSDAGPLGATLSFFADQDGMNVDGIPLGGSISGVNGTGTADLDLGGLTDGLWHIYVIMTDGTSVPQRLYSSSQARVSSGNVTEVLVGPIAGLSAISAIEAEGNAGNTGLTFTVSLSQASAEESTIEWSVEGLGMHAADVADFGGILPSGPLRFAAGETSKTVTLFVAGDTVVEFDENFVVTLSNPSVGLVLGTSTAVGTIQNDDRSTVSITALAAMKSEGSSGGTTSYTFTVSLSQAGVTSQTASWAVTGSGANSADAADFVGGGLAGGTVMFLAGETSKTIAVGVAGDVFVEDDEGFAVTLSNPSSGLTLGTASASGMIQNDDIVAEMVTYGDAYIVQEGQALTVALSNGLLANDLNASSVSLISGPVHGGVQLATSGNFSYTPATGFHGIDSFTYHAGNGSSGVANEQVVLYVVPVNVGVTTTLDLVALTAEEQIAATYVAFFGRGADDGGLNFWVGEFMRGLPTQGPAALFANIASSFGISSEAKALYPFLVDPFNASDGQISAFLGSVYDSLFNRMPDAAGLDYWTGAVKQTLQAGQFVGSVLVNIMSGAQDTAAGRDITTLMGKVAVSLDYVQAQREHHTPWLPGDSAAATTLLQAVTSDPLSVLIGIRNADNLIAAHA